MGRGSPHPSVNADLFIARWTRTLNLAPGEYEFTATADDGVRLYIDGAAVIDKWVDQATSTYTVRLPMDGAPHSLVLEYYEHGFGAVAKLGITRVGSIPDPPAYQAEYWNNRDASGSPSIPTGPADLARTEEAVDGAWYGGSPNPSITPDNFIARWTRTDVLSAGLYLFSGASDDGIRVFVDDVPVVNMWQPQNAPFSVDKVLAAGPHAIRVEYFEAGGDAQAVASYSRIGDVQPEDGYFKASYFGNRDLAGDPVLTREEPEIDHDWGGGSPGVEVPVDNFSARWTKTVQVPAGNYTFTSTTDDGARLFVDGTLVIDRWVLQGPTAHSAVVALAEGPHQIVLEYFEAGAGANARFEYGPTEESPPPPPGPSNPFAAEYFANPDLAGPPTVTRTDAAVDFDWGQAGSPDPAVPTDLSSARWTRTRDYEAGTYRFTVTGDDGIRLLVDGALAIDGWRDQWATTYTADVALTAGQHTVVVEYYDRTGGAIVRFSEVTL